MTSEGGRVRRTALRKRELQGGGVVARVKSGGLRLTDGAVLMRVSYRQAKRLWKRYQAGGVARLKHANAGRRSNRARPAKTAPEDSTEGRGKIRGLWADAGGGASGPGAARRKP